ncbi:hypothetical protein K440DRAFT_202699 [Wilcoxina mikolae CBS 423.85]|nr:hypothetical protein K440DRAFT_202699 [Wilcoxina mikolae CBS 423.85]
MSIIPNAFKYLFVLALYHPLTLVYICGGGALLFSDFTCPSCRSCPCFCRFPSVYKSYRKIINVIKGEPLEKITKAPLSHFNTHAAPRSVILGPVTIHITSTPRSSSQFFFLSPTDLLTLKWLPTSNHPRSLGTPNQQPNSLRLRIHNTTNSHRWYVLSSFIIVSHLPLN